MAQHDNEPSARDESIATPPRKNSGPSSASVNNSARARAMVNVAIPRQTLLKIVKINPVESRRKTLTEIPFSSKSKRHPVNKNELSDAYSKLSQVRDIYDSVVVEASAQEKNLKELEGLVEVKHIGDDTSNRHLAANERIISELTVRLEQCHDMNDKATRIQSVHEQILVVLQSCQPSLSTKHLELSQQIALSKQQITDIRAQQVSIDGEISRIRASFEQVASLLHAALEERTNEVQPHLETLQCKAKEDAERKKSERIASFDPSAFSYRMKKEGIMAKRRMRCNANESKLHVDADNSSSLHPMEKISLISGSLDPLDIVQKTKAAELLAKDLTIKQKRSELHIKEQRVVLDGLQRQLKEFQLTDRATQTRVDASLGQDSINELNSLIQSRQSNLTTLACVMDSVDFAVEHLSDLSESIECEASENIQFNSFLFATGECKSCLSQDVEKLIKAVQLIRNSTEHFVRNPPDANSNASRSKATLSEICSESFVSRRSEQKFHPNTRVLNKSARKSMYIEVTKKLHDVEDEKYGDDESDRGHNSERDFDKLSQYVRQARTNASSIEQRRANTLCRTSQKHKGLILEAVLQRQSP